jgi:hypothetical protein
MGYFFLNSAHKKAGLSSLLFFSFFKRNRATTHKTTKIIVSKKYHEIIISLHISKNAKTNTQIIAHLPSL